MGVRVAAADAAVFDERRSRRLPQIRVDEDNGKY
jgi:hypothetical protein